MKYAISDYKVFILVGGLGTRLRSEVKDVPKPMAPINGKPFLEYKVQNLINNGFREFVFCSGYLCSTIEEYFGNGSDMNISIEYSVEKEPLGTAGAIKNASDLIDRPFFTTNGDTFLDFNPQKLIEFSKQKSAICCIYSKKIEHSSQVGFVLFNGENKITQFIEKPKKAVIGGFMNTGTYYFQPEILDLIPPNKKVSMEKEIFPQLIEEKRNFYTCDYEGYFIDIGTPKNYFCFIEDIERNKIPM